MIEELKKDLMKWKYLLSLIIRNQSFDNNDITYVQNEINKIQELLNIVSE